MKQDKKALKAFWRNHEAFVKGGKKGCPPLYPMQWYTEVNKPLWKRRKSDLSGNL
jgi:hypothetical protein